MFVNNKSISYLTKEECFGCRSCEQVCPEKCISVLPDEEGFLYPRLKQDLCINCRLCTKHCPAVRRLPEIPPMEFLGVKLKDKSLCMESSSGGVFAGLADWVLEKKGCIFGCAFDDNLKARHIKVESKENLFEIKKSKYVSSDTLKTYSEVSHLLETEPDKIILYTGTPCQIHGLKTFLGNDPKNLYTADIVCHGVPSQKLFNKYLECLEKKIGEKIIYYGFRDKEVSGWKCAGKTTIKTKTKRKIINGAIDPYYSSFIRGETCRLTCYKCPFSNINHRPADITMGDFWGIEYAHPDFFSKAGVSCCILNTEKGKELFLKVAENFEYIRTSAEKMVMMNGNLVKPSKKPAIRDSIYAGIDEVPVDKIISRLYAPLNKRIERYLISLIPHDLKVVIKKIIHKRYGNYAE